MLNARERGESHGDFLFGVSVVDQFAREEIRVGLHIKMSMTAEVENDVFGYAVFFATVGFLDGNGDGVA